MTKSGKLHDSLASAVLLEAQDLAHTDTASAWLDTKGYAGADLIVAIGALTGVDGSNYVLPILQESDLTTDVSASNVATADIAGAFTSVNSSSLDSVVQRVGYCGSKRYVRVKLDYTGTAISAGICGVYAIVGFAHNEPAAAPTVTAAT
jgi:hypothetical protein